MAVQNLTIVEMLFKQIKNSGEIAVFSTQTTYSSATGSVLQILMTPILHVVIVHPNQKNNFHFDYVYLFGVSL